MTAQGLAAVALGSLVVVLFRFISFQYIVCVVGHTLADQSFEGYCVSACISDPPLDTRDAVQSV